VDKSPYKIKIQKGQGY